MEGFEEEIDRHELFERDPELYYYYFGESTEYDEDDDETQELDFGW